MRWLIHTTCIYSGHVSPLIQLFSGTLDVNNHNFGNGNEVLFRRIFLRALGKDLMKDHSITQSSLQRLSRTTRIRLSNLISQNKNPGANSSISVVTVTTTKCVSSLVGRRNWQSSPNELVKEAANIFMWNIVF